MMKNKYLSSRYEMLIAAKSECEEAIVDFAFNEDRNDNTY